MGKVMGPRPLAGADYSAVRKWEEEVVRHKTLNDAKLAVMEAVSYVKKISTEGLSYTFVSEEELLQVVRPAMVKNGLTLSPVAVQQFDTGEYKTTKGSVVRVVRLAVRYELRCSLENGTEAVQVIESVGEGSDSLDKGTSKAMTAAQKTAIREIFLIASGDDPDRWASQEIVEVLRSEDKEAEKSVLKFLGAIASAERQERLDQFRKAYGERDFSDEQLARLEEAYKARVVQLKKIKPENT